jgi:amino acid adenylation domain-containing protein
MSDERLERLAKLSPAKRALLDRALRERAAGGAAPRIPRRGGGPAPLSSGQQRMWLAQQMDPGSPASNLPAALRLDGPLDRQALTAALGEVVRRHEVLRSGIEAPDGEPVLIVAAPSRFALPLIDLADLPGPVAEREGRRLAGEEALLPFDLARPPLLRALLARLGEAAHLLLLTLHHAAADGWSLALLIRETGVLYGAFAAGQPSPLPELPIQYSDYAAWQQGRLAGGELAADLAWWRERLAGLPPLALPAGGERPSGRAVRRTLLLPQRLTAGMRDLAQQEGATLFMVLAAAFAAFLGWLAGQDDVAFAIPVAGRTRAETEELIGFFVNTLVLRADLSGAPPFRLLLARLRASVAAAHAHQDLPFERLVEELAPARRAGRHPLVRTLLAFQNAPREALALPGLAVTRLEVETGTALFDLALEVEPRDGELAAHLEADAGLWEAAAVERLLEQFAALLAAAVGEPDRPLEALTPWPPLPCVPLPPAPNGRGGTPAELLPGTEETAERLAAIFSDVLGLPAAGLHDSFWDLGGHSLQAARVVARVRRDLGVEIPLRALFDAPTAFELAELAGGGAPADSSADSSMNAADRDRAPALSFGPLSFGQQRLWFLQQLAPESPAYNIPFGVRLDGALDVRALAAALSEVVRRHEVLRTAIVTRRGEAFQEVAPPALLRLPLVDLAGLPALRREEETARLAAAEARRPFDLTRAPLLRALLLRLEGDVHSLVLDLHHIAGDGWSGAVLVREAGALYSFYSSPAGFAAGRPSPLPELPLQYADYARWQREQLAGEPLERLLAFWRESLAGLPPLALPTDRPRPPAESFRGVRRARTLPAELAADLGRLAAGGGATLFMVLAAGLSALLGRLSEQEDFGLATPVAGRARTELEGLIGFFVNTLVLRTDLTGDPRFTDLLVRTRETVLAAQDHQALPFERLVEELGERRDPARQPLAQALLVLQNTPREPLVLPGLTLTPCEIDNGTAKLDLSLDVLSETAGLSASLEVNRDLFDATTAERMLDQLATLLAGAVEDPGLPVSALPLLSAAARHQILREWGGADADCGQKRVLAFVGAVHGMPSGTPCGRPGWAAASEQGGLLQGGHAGCLRHPADRPYENLGTTLHRLFAAQAARRPDAVAVTGEEGESLSYGELDRRANRLARHLRSLGAGPEVRVGICLPRSPELVVAILAVLKAGGAYVPLDPDDPRERLSFLLEDARALLVVTRSGLSGLFAPGVRQVRLDTGAQAIARRSPRALTGGALPDHPAYVIYTSGSTGQPKGVVVTHRNVARLFTAAMPWLGRAESGEEDVWTLFHSVAFDFSVWEIWGALLHGGRLVVVPYWVSRSPDDFLALLRRERVTVLNQTPSAFRPLIRAAAAADGADREPIALRWVLFGGEALDPRHLSPWLARFGDRAPRLANLYGITETTVHVTFRRLAREDSLAAGSPVGRPLADLSIRLLDRCLHPVPLGVPGEICVGGAGLARGYLGRPELTAERFVPDPHGEAAGARLYRSGDLARRLPDGGLEVLGRIDHQVKVRGFRIEPGEIEAVLEAHPQVRESAVVVREDGEGESRLIAYVVAEEGEIRSAGLRAFLQERLPGHMVPAAFVTLPALPLTRNGKLDRAALPAPGGAAASEAPFAPPETPVERAVAASWAEVLGVPQVGLDDDFFALGGDSIRSIQARVRAEEKGVLFSIQDLFLHPTVRTLAGAVRSASAPGGGAEAAEPAIAGDLLAPADRARLPTAFEDPVEDAYPLARALAGLVFHSEYSPDYLIYVTSLHLRAPFDAPALEQALAQVVARHPVLRSSFALEGFSEPLHVVHRELRVPLEVEDLRGLAPAEQEAALEAWLAAEQCRGFDWRRPPLLRLRIHRRSDEAFQVTLSEPFLDGWSVGLFLTELFHRYLLLLPAGSVPAAASLPPLDDRPLASSFRGFVALERAALAAAETRLFWERRMDGGGAGSLPARPALRRGEPHPLRSLVGHLEVPLPGDVSDALWAAARAASVPLKSLLLAIHLKLLSFLTGASDVVSGVLANGRPEQAGGDRVIGGFLNAMPFRADLAPGSWAGLARQAFEAERELLPHRRFPMAEVLSAQPNPGLPGRPLFDTLFNFTHFHVYERLESLPGVAVLGSWGSEQTYFPLTVQANVHEMTRRISLSLDHPLSSLDIPAAEEIAARYARLLAAVAAAPGAPHDGLSLLTPAERQQALVEWNDTALPAAERTVPELFAAQAARAPGAPAILWGEAVVTYGELAARAGRVARRLLASGVGAEERVGILLERSPDLVAVILGVLAAGAAYVPLDPAYPRERLETMLDDSGVAPWAVDWERIDVEGLEPLDLSDPASLPWIDPAQLFAVIYTSGSTGRPKGVAVEHRSVAAFLAGAGRVYSPEERSGVLAAASVCFDLSVFELFFPLTGGGTVILAENVLELPRLPARDAVRLAGIVPSAAAELLREGGIPPSVRALMLGGEAVPPGLARALGAGSPGRRVFNAYGPTEATVYSALGLIPEEDAGAPPIGRAAPGDRAVLLDADRQPVPTGVPGEIWLGGRGLARGYLGRPDLTAERFRPDPFAGPAGEPGGRLYRTGDLGRLLPDGRIEFLGRRDGQVKVRGFRIELGEIEAALARHPGIAGAVVVDRRDPDAPGDTRLVAYVVHRRGLRGPGSSELRAFLRAVLPAHMIPSAFVALDALPLTSTGKVDRRALPAPEPERRERPEHAERSWTAPRTPVEEVLCGIWEQVFGLARVSADDDFFALGGHSLLATQLISRLRGAFALELPLRALFDAPVLSELAGVVENALREGEGTAAPPLVPQPRPAAGIPLSFAQQRLWFLDRLEPESSFYNVPVAVRLHGSLHPAALGAALREIVRRHEALRTRFPEVDGRPVQAVADDNAAAPPLLPGIDLAGLPGVRREAEAARLAADAGRRPFDLARGPLLRLALLRLGRAEHLLLAVFHHIVADGWSMGVFLRETAELYRAFTAGEPAPLPPLGLQYADFALWQRGWLTGEALDRQLAWWQGRLAGVPPLALPTDRPRPATPAYRGARCPFALPPLLAAEIGALARREGATLFMTLFAAFSAVLGRWACQEALAVGTPVAHRTRTELEPLIGFFVNTLVLPADLAGDPTGRDLLGRCREAALGAYAHQDLPFERLVEELRPERDLARAPLFQVLLALQSTPLPAFDLPGLTLTPVEVETGTAKFDLTLSVAEMPEGAGIMGWLEHDLHLFDPTTARRLAGHLAAALEGLAADPDRRLSALPLLAAAERHQLLWEWAEPAETLPEGGLGSPGIAERIAGQARRTPDAVAVAQGGREVTYRELDRGAARLAGTLRARGVGPEVTVAIHLPKSPEAVVAILAVLRAGGCYLPLDPAYPEERLAWLRQDARAAVTLGSKDCKDFKDIKDCKDCKDLEDDALVPAESAAYILYTSGSTGRPKGVVVSRGNLLASTLARLEGYAPPVSAFLILPSFAFDSSVAGIFWTLLQGGTLVLPEEGEAADPVRLARLVAARRVSHWLSIPSLYSLLLDAAGPRQLRSLAAVIVAGEACPVGLPGRHCATLPGVPLLNEYGPTEGTVWATAGALPAGEGQKVDIGRPIAGARVLLLDRALRPVPAGVPGELAIGGAGLARGYLGRPDLTAERFVPDPLATAPGARLYRTGDLARWLSDGRIDLLGRLDEQVKVRGFRIEPGEIETALESSPGVIRAAVVTRDLPSGDRRLVGCITGHADLDAAALRGSLARRLPAHMVPAELIVLAELPLSANGKVDRAALKRLLADQPAGRPAGSGASTPPAGALEKRLAAIWEELLGVAEVGREDGFFALGGHSLLTVQLVSRIEKELGRRLPLAALFRGATLASLAAEIRAAPAAGSPAAVSPPLVLLRAGGAGLPFFWFHPLGGRAACYTDLARRLPGRPLFGVEAEESGEESLPDLAALYAAALTAQAPRGPYLLGGWSFGGLLAWETARRLEESGEKVALLVLVDSRPPSPGFAGFAEADLQVDDAALDDLLRAELAGAGSAVVAAELPVLRARVRAHLQALRDYRPGPLAGPAALFLAAGRPAAENADTVAAWLSLAPGGLAVETLPGDHFSLLREPGVAALGERIRRRLATMESFPTGDPDGSESP